MPSLTYIDESIGQEVMIRISSDVGEGVDNTMRNLVEPMLLASGYQPETINEYIIEWADELREVERIRLENIMREATRPDTDSRGGSDPDDIDYNSHI